MLVQSLQLALRRCQDGEAYVILTLRSGVQFTGRLESTDSARTMLTTLQVEPVIGGTCETIELGMVKIDTAEIVAVEDRKLR